MCIDQVLGAKNCEILLYETFYPHRLHRNYDIKSNGYSVFFEIALESFKDILRHKNIDFEFFFLFRDKEESMGNSLSENVDCEFCQTKHCKFRCPRLHYMPIAQQVIYRHIVKENKQKAPRKNIRRSKKEIKIFHEYIDTF